MVVASFQTNGCAWKFEAPQIVLRRFKPPNWRHSYGLQGSTDFVSMVLDGFKDPNSFFSQKWWNESCQSYLLLVTCFLLRKEFDIFLPDFFLGSCVDTLMCKCRMMRFGHLLVSHAANWETTMNSRIKKAEVYFSIKFVQFVRLSA